jgi:hypothetical protein
LGVKTISGKGESITGWIIIITVIMTVITWVSIL